MTDPVQAIGLLAQALAMGGLLGLFLVAMSVMLR